MPLGELRPTAGQPRRASCGHQLSKTLFQRPFKHLNTHRPAVNMTKMCASGRYVETEPSGHKRSPIPTQKKSGLRSSHSDVPWCPSLVCRPESLRGHGCRCHEPRDVRRCFAVRTLRQQKCSLVATSPASVRRCFAVRTLRQQKCSLAATSPASVKRCFAVRTLRQQKCSLVATSPASVKRCFAGDCCDNKASSDAQAPLRGARDQYSKTLRVFEEAKTCATSSSCSYSEGSDDP